MSRMLLSTCFPPRSFTRHVVLRDTRDLSGARRFENRSLSAAEFVRWRLMAAANSASHENETINSRTTEFGGGAHTADTFCIVFFFFVPFHFCSHEHERYARAMSPASDMIAIDVASPKRINKITCKFIFIRIYECKNRS